MNGFQFFGRIFDIDINVKICFMSSGEINRDALREIHLLVWEAFSRNHLQSNIYIKKILGNYW